MSDILRMTSRSGRNIIADLARSIEISVKQLALRAKFTATIADAEKAAYAAERLRTTAIHSADLAEQSAGAGDTNEIKIVPRLARMLNNCDEADAHTQMNWWKSFT